MTPKNQNRIARGIERGFGDGREPDAKDVELVEQFDQLTDGSGDQRHPRHHHNVDLAGPRIGEEPIELRTAASTAGLDVALDERPAVLRDQPRRRRCLHGGLAVMAVRPEVAGGAERLGVVPPA